MTGFLLLIGLFVLLAIGAVVIAALGGWQGGCGGNCAACRRRCEHRDAPGDPHDPQT